VASFRADQKQVANICASDEQHQSYAPHQHPQGLVYVADNVLFQRPEVRPDSSIVHNFWVEAYGHGKTLCDNGKHLRHVRVGLLQCDSRLKPGDGFIAEVPEESSSTVELEGQEHRDAPSAEVKVLRQHANNLPQFSVGSNRLSNY